MGGYGMRLRDGSCQGQSLGQGNRMGQPRSASGPGFLDRFLTGANSANGVSTAPGIESLLSAITDLKQQIDALKNQSGK
jgi:hypothetical protein